MKKTDKTLLAFISERIRCAEQMRGKSTVRNYRYAANKLREYLNGKDVALRAVTGAFMQSYEAWLRRGGLSPNTVSFHFRLLRVFYRQAVAEGYTMGRADLFKQVHTRMEETRKRAVFSAFIRRLVAIDLSRDQRLAYARDLFLFSFYTCGMSFVDMAFLHKRDVCDGLLSYRRSKTKQLITVRLTPHATAIVARWGNPQSPRLLPIITHEPTAYSEYKSADRQQNRLLHHLGVLLGMGAPLTMYVARHSWASIAYRQGVEISVISRCLGHESEHTTHIYLTQLQQDRLDRANRRVLQSVAGF